MFKNLSMQKKFIASFLPVLISSCLVAFFIYKSGTEDNSELRKALSITDVVGRQELAMVNMSEALRGYLINPKDTSEFDRKKKNDALYAELAEELSKLAGSNPDIKKLNDEMAKLDATELDDKENKVAELIKIDQPKAVAFFQAEYAPFRNKQNENFSKLKELTAKMSREIVAADNKNRKEIAILTIIFLIASTVIGFIFCIYISRKITLTTNDILNIFRDTTSDLSLESNKLLDKSRQLSDATSLESSAIQETASTMHEITLMANKTSENSTLSKKLSGESSEKSLQGVDAINKMLTSIDNINNYQSEIINVVESSNQKISEIVNVISDIEAKTKVINEIVFQTKLLSFNASVEAARAGENGKGFAVVAEEIGSLATLSGKASEEINSLLAKSVQTVNQIVSSTKSSLKESMDKSKVLISDGKRIASDCSHVLSDINSSVAQTTDAINEITTATTEQSRGISEVNTAIEQLNQTVQGNSTIARDAHSVSTILNQKSDELREIVSKLEELINGSAR